MTRMLNNQLGSCVEGEQPQLKRLGVSKKEKGGGGGGGAQLSESTIMG